MNSLTLSKLHKEKASLEALMNEHKAAVEECEAKLEALTELLNVYDGGVAKRTKKVVRRTTPVTEAFSAALKEMPEEFTSEDHLMSISAILERKLDASVYSDINRRFREDGILEQIVRGRGRKPGVYRKTTKFVEDAK